MLKLNSILESLNESQREAVTWDKGPLLIVAGAGTGKTNVITCRCAWLIANKSARPEEILALTFTDKAAAEMETRVDMLVPYGMVPVWISTFHSFCQQILSEYAFDLGINPDFKILTEPELLVFLKERLFELPLKYFLPLSYPTKYLKSLLKVISRIKDEDVGVDKYLEYAYSQIDCTGTEEANKQLEIANCYQKYEALLTEAGYVDMPGLITLTLRLLRTKSSVLSELQSKFKYVLVDEFQDTNYTQFQLLQLLVSTHRNITVVGDDDQAIYKFRGACLANILTFQDLYPDAHQIVLTDNYRSTQRILDTSRRLILFNDPNRLERKAGCDKVLKSHPAHKFMCGTKVKNQNGELNLFEKKVEYMEYDTVSTEADAIAKLIEERVKRSGLLPKQSGLLPKQSGLLPKQSGLLPKLDYKYSDFAILVRTNSMADEFLRALNLRGLPWRFSGNQGLYDREEIQVLLSLLRVLRDVKDSQSLYVLLTSPGYKLNPLDINKWFGIAYRTKKSLYEVIKGQKTEDRKQKTENREQNSIDAFLSDIEYFMSLSLRESTGKVLYEFLYKTGWLQQMVSNPSIENEIKIKNIAQFFNIVDKVSSIIRINKAPFVISHIEGLMELGDNPPVAEADSDIDAVQVLTVHKAKGLEFRVVFMVGLTMNNFPHRKMPTLVELPTKLIKEPLPELSIADISLQEERRLFYVGMTRTKEELILSSAKNYGPGREGKLSQFVIEALDIVKKTITTQKKEAMERIKGFGATQITDMKRAKQTGIVALSSTAIDNWLTCPRKYWYINWLKVPTPKHHTLVYGGAVHTAIERYLFAKHNSRILTIEEVIKIFESAWESEGFISLSHEEERFKQGKEVLARFVKEEEGSDTIPTLVEEPFHFMVDDIRINGRWDRVDIKSKISRFFRDPDTAGQNPKSKIRKDLYELNEHNEGVIIDYKTGEVETLDKARGRVRDSIQLPIYALAFMERFGILPTRVEFWFVDTGIRAELKDISKKTEEAKKTIKKVAQGIRDYDFEPRPKYMSCDFCPCRVICDFKKQ
ncbi:MAG: ATP-dependent helicase [Candidatus Stahlbacteria bacterium]|nr:ATP-dependent helicase [Candidatus Stahlbacteria bacterium]